MPDPIRFPATITVVYPSNASDCSRQRNPYYSPAEDSVQISNEAQQKSREFFLEMLKGSWVATTGSQCNQPRGGVDIFKLPANATKDQIRKAYIAAIKKYHPDKFADLCPEFQKLAEEKSKQINLAYRKLNRRDA